MKWSTKCEYRDGVQGDSASAWDLILAAVTAESCLHCSHLGTSPCSYGMNQSWTAIPNCMSISGHCCDLTYYTLDSALRYYARVRAVSGNHTSPWQRTNSFSPQEGRLGICLHSMARGYEDGRGQGAKLLVENFGSRDFSLFIPTWRAAGLWGEMRQSTDIQHWL